MRDILILVIALCVDTFVASIAYGADRLHISSIKIIAVNGICSVCLGAALFFGGLINGLVTVDFAKGVAFFLLLLLGVLKLMDYTIKRYINNHVSIHKDLAFTISGFSIIINIYGNPLAADWDNSKSLSWKETVMFSLAMSIDSLLAGTLSGFLMMPPLLTTMAAFVVGIVAMYIGLFLGHKLALLKNWDLSWISGILFLVLAFCKL